MSEKAKGSKRKPGSIKHMTDILKRSIVFLVCICLIGTNIPVYPILGADEEDIVVPESGIFSISLESLTESTENAVTDGEPLSEEIYEFTGNNAAKYEELFDTEDGLLYEIYPELDEECDSLSLRTFVKIRKSDLEEVSSASPKSVKDGSEADNEQENPEEDVEDGDEAEDVESALSSDYNVTGNEEIIFLLINDSDEEVSTRILVTASEDEVYETREITVPGNKDQTNITINTVESMSESMSDAVYFVIDDKQDNMRTASLRVESGSNADEVFSDDSNNVFYDPEDDGEKENTGEEENTEGTKDSEGLGKAQETEHTEYTEESLEKNNVASMDVGTVTVSSEVPGSMVSEVSESASNASVSAYTEGCIPMKGELYGAASADGMKAVAFVTSMKDLGFEVSVKTYSLVYEGPDYTVTLEYDSYAGIPEDAELTGEEYDPDSDTYIERFEEAKELYGWEDGSEPTARLFDVSLTSDGEEIEPDAPVRVTFTFYDDEDEDTAPFLMDSSEQYEDAETENEADGEESGSVSEEQSLTIIHFGADGSETVGSETSYDEGGRSVTFTLDSLSDIMVLAYTETAYDIVFSLSNDNGLATDWSGELYSSGYNGADRVTVSDSGMDILKNNADSEGNITIKLPSDSDLNKNFTIYPEDETPGPQQNAVTVSLGNIDDNGYDYKLYGWYNLGTGEYYDVSDGSVTAEINLGKRNVFYADCYADSYNVGHSTDSNQAESVSTEFVDIKLFDYNELFNLYSTNVSSATVTVEDGSSGDTRTGEVFSDSTGFYDAPAVLSVDGSKHAGTKNGDISSFITKYNNIGHSDVYTDSNGNPAKYTDFYPNIFYPGDLEDWNEWIDGYNLKDAKTVWGIESSDYTKNALLNALFNPETEELGVKYIGPADYLFQYGMSENGAPEEYIGYYYYSSNLNAAAYNRDEQRFYIYNEPEVYDDDHSMFLPFQDHSKYVKTDDDLNINYLFGMSMEVNFYLPFAVNGSTAGSEGVGNKDTNGNDLIFRYSGDDDILIFVDDDLILDMSGIHLEADGSINFNKGTWEMSNVGATPPADNPTQSKSGTFALSAGSHKLTVYYLERGTGYSNLTVSFNLAPVWYYRTGAVQAVTAEKTWVSEDGNEIAPDTYEGILPSVTVGLYDGLEEADQPDSNGYTKQSSGNGYEYTYTFTDPETGEETTYIYVTVMSAGQETPVSFSIGDATYETKNDDGWIVDPDGVPLAKLEEGILWILMDTQDLNEENKWYYAWDLLDADGNYKTMEISSDWTYKYLEDESTLTSGTDIYTYWTVIGEEEIESEDGKVGITEAVILTDAAEHNEAIGSVHEAEGYVIVCSEEGDLSLETVMFSQHTTFEAVTDEEIGLYYYSECGVCSAADIEALGWGALWYLDPYMVNGTAGTITDSSGRTIQPFYLYCVDENEGEHYLTIRTFGEGDNKTYSVITTDEPEDLFFYDSLGELIAYNNNTTDPGLNDEFIVTISKNDNGNIYIRAAAAGETPDDNDVRFYTLNENFETTVTKASYVNQILPDLTLVKEDGTGNEVYLKDVSFTLQSVTTGLYYSVSSENGDTGTEGDESGESGTDENEPAEPESDETESSGSNVKVVWTDKPCDISTDEKGNIIFYGIEDGEYILTETKAADGYNPLPAAVKITVADGKITNVEWYPDDNSSGIRIDSYVNFVEGEIKITIENYAGAVLPEAGGAGTLPFKLTGVLLMSASALLYLALGRKKKANADISA